MVNKNRLVLSIFASIGVIGVGVSSSIAMKKTMEEVCGKEVELSLQNGENVDLEFKEKIKIASKHYIPTILLGTLTLGNIWAGYVVGNKEQAKLLASNVMLVNTFNEYRKAIIDDLGEDVDKNIVEKVSKNHYEETYPDTKINWYEPITRTFFEAYESDVLNAEYYFNREYQLHSKGSFLDWLDMLGIEVAINKVTNELGWEISTDGWVDFEHLFKNDRDEPYIEIRYVNKPHRLRH